MPYESIKYQQQKECDNSFTGTFNSLLVALRGISYLFHRFILLKFQLGSSPLTFLGGIYSIHTER